MRKTILILLVTLIYIGCDSDDTLIFPENTSVYHNENFIQVEGQQLSVNDALLFNNGSVIAAGNSSRSTSSPEPFFINVNLSGQIEHLVFPVFDNLGDFRPIDLLPTKDGNFIFLSHNDAEPLSFNRDVDVIKLSAEGVILWRRAIGDAELDERAYSVDELPNGDLVIVGQENLDFLGSDHFLLIRISDTGDLIWSKRVEEERVFSCRKILFSPEDNTLLVLTEHLVLANSRGQIKLTKLDLDGNVLKTTLALENMEFSSSNSDMVLLEDNSILVYYTQFDGHSFKDGQIRVLNYNADLSEKYNRSFPDLDYNIISHIAMLQNGNIVMLSHSSDFGNSLDVVMTNVNPAGEVVWRSIFGGAASELGLRIFEKANNNLVVVGSTNEGLPESIFNMFVMETDGNGSPL